jgi:hypothetical protein
VIQSRETRKHTKVGKLMSSTGSWTFSGKDPKMHRGWADALHTFDKNKDDEGIRRDILNTLCVKDFLAAKIKQGKAGQP